MAQSNSVTIHEGDLGVIIGGMNASMREWTAKAARGECEWLCSDCLLGDPKGMPDECLCGHQSCTEIIQRDKREAMQEGTEPF